MFGNDQTQQQNDNVNPSFSGVQPANNGLMGLDDQATKQPASEAPSSTNDTMQPTAPESTDSDVNVTPPIPDDHNDELINIKKEALMELSPLVNQLDQSADEKFETLMMMIQASDNKSLVPQAFESAKNISDDKKRARALLDVINEINYFNQKENKA